jgi:hypothetical protein
MKSFITLLTPGIRSEKTDDATPFLLPVKKSFETVLKSENNLD